MRPLPSRTVRVCGLLAWLVSAPAALAADPTVDQFIDALRWLASRFDGMSVVYHQREAVENMPLEPVYPQVSSEGWLVEFGPESVFTVYRRWQGERFLMHRRVDETLSFDPTSRQRGEVFAVSWSGTEFRKASVTADRRHAFASIEDVYLWHNGPWPFEAGRLMLEGNVSWMRTPMAALFEDPFPLPDAVLPVEGPVRLPDGRWMIRRCFPPPLSGNIEVIVIGAERPTGGVPITVEEIRVRVGRSTGRCGDEPLASLRLSEPPHPVLAECRILPVQWSGEEIDPARPLIGRYAAWKHAGEGGDPAERYRAERIELEIVEMSRAPAAAEDFLLPIPDRASVADGRLDVGYHCGIPGGGGFVLDGRFVLDIPEDREPPGGSVLWTVEDIIASGVFGPVTLLPEGVREQVYEGPSVTDVVLRDATLCSVAFDAGSVVIRGREAVPISHTARVTNETGQVLEVQAGGASCGCMATRRGPSTLQPGETADFTVGFAVATPGYTTQVGWFSFDRENPGLMISLSATGILPFELRVLRESPWLEADARHRVRLLVLDAAGGGEREPPQVDVPEGIRVTFDGWRWLEPGLAAAARPGRQIATVAFDASDYDGPWPVDVTVRLASGGDVQTFAINGPDPLPLRRTADMPGAPPVLPSVVH
ncbi:MAG: DUF1573 domain-containing protein [Phycisphaeraceae bacterium]|nr:DUF1573 domain-containing protein [Phycisphaeraceae bacterium]